MSWQHRGTEADKVISYKSTVPVLSHGQTNPLKSEEQTEDSGCLLFSLCTFLQLDGAADMGVQPSEQEN
jgi:hypothetical protein